MIARMFFHWFINQQILGLFLYWHRTCIGQILRHWVHKWANVQMNLEILDMNDDYLEKEVPD